MEIFVVEFLSSIDKFYFNNTSLSRKYIFFLTKLLGLAFFYEIKRRCRC